MGRSRKYKRGGLPIPPYVLTEQDRRNLLEPSAARPTLSVLEPPPLSP